MMLVRNPRTFIETPELGMGFHFARNSNQAQSKHGQSDFAVIIHCLVAVDRAELFNEHYADRLYKIFRQLDRTLSLGGFSSHPFDDDFATEQFGGLDETRSAFYEIENNSNRFIEFLDAPSHFRERYMERRLHESPPFSRSARLTDKMHRYSILRADPRIGPNGELSPGTYAAPSSESTFVQTGLAAVGRFALPALLPRCYKFAVSPPDGTPMKVGACQSNFGQAGGGVEVEFTSALPPGSTIFETHIPEF